MYLGQRLIGVGVYAFCAIITYFFIPRIKGIRTNLNVYICLLGLMGFFYVPMSGADLSRAYATMHLYGNMSMREVWNVMLSHGSPTSVLYYHIIGRLGNDRLLPCITAVLTYGFIFSIIKSYYKNNEIEKKLVAISLLFFMSRGLLIATISNIRTMLALSLIAYSIYKVLYEKEDIVKYIVLMIVGALLHNVGLAAVLLFFVYYIIKGTKYRNRLLTLVESLVLVVGIFAYGKTYILSAINKGKNYLGYSQSNTGYFYIWEMVLSLIVILYTFIIIFCYYRNHCKVFYSSEEIEEKEGYSTFVGFVLALSIFSFVSIFIEFNLGQRLSYLLSILDIPLFMMILNSNRYSYQERAKIYNWLLFGSFLLMAIACTRGDLCSLKFV